MKTSIFKGNDKKVHDLGLIAGLKAASEIVQKYSEEYGHTEICGVLNAVDEEIEDILAKVLGENK